MQGGGVVNQVAWRRQRRGSSHVSKRPPWHGGVQSSPQGTVATAAAILTVSEDTGRVWAEMCPLWRAVWSGQVEKGA